jgi:putative transposase
MFRRGTRTLELIRELADGKLALEDCITRRQVVYDRDRVLRLVWAGEMAVVDQNGVDVKGESPTPLTMATLTPAAQKTIERRLAYVTAVRKAHLSRGMRGGIAKLIGSVAERLGDANPPSDSTVMSWARRFDANQGYAGALVDRNAVRRRSSRVNPIMEGIIEAMLRRVYLTPDCNSLIHTLAEIHRESARKVLAGQMPSKDARLSLATLSRRVASIDRYRLIEARQGSARARMVCRTSMDGATAEYPLQRVEVDHTPLNWAVICDRTGLSLGRPLLTALIDAHSNYLLGFYISFYGPGLTSVSGALRCAISPKDEMTKGLSLEHRWLAAGVPDWLVLDNGLEFHSPVFQRMGYELRMSFTYCRVRTPWLKPHIEGFFRSLNSITLAKGRIHKRVANVVGIDPNQGAAVTFSDFVRGIVQFVVDVHPFQINQRKLARPYDLYSDGIERMPPVHFPFDMESLRMASAMSKELTVGPGGVELQGLPFGGAELLGMRKHHGERFKTLVKWDPDDLSQIWVQDPQNKRWVDSACRWPEYARDLSWNQHVAIRKFARQEFKNNGAMEYLERARLRLHDHWMEAVALKTRADRKLAAVAAGYTSARVLAADCKPAATTSAEAARRSSAPAAVPPSAPLPVPLCHEEFETVDLN